MEYQPSTILPPIEGSTKFGGTQSRIIMGGVNCQNVGTQYIPCIEIAGETTAQYGLKIAGSVVSRVTTPNTSVYTIDKAYSFLNDNALPTGTVVATGLNGDPVTYDAVTGVLTGVTTEAFVAGTAYWCKEIITISDGITLYLYTPTTAGRDIKEVYDKVENITSVTGDINAAKAELAQEITAKGVATSPTAPLTTMADNVHLIQQETYELEGDELYEKQMFGAETDTTTPYEQPGSPLWNLYAIMANLKSDARFVNYGGIMLAEYYKGYDSIELQGAGASGGYFTCDGDYYTTDATHVWHDTNNGKMNRWIAYLFANSNTNYQIPSENLCPRSIHIGREVGTIIQTTAGRICEIVVTDGNKLGDLQTNGNLNPWGRNIIIKGLKKLSHELFFISSGGNLNISSICLEVENITCNCLYSRVYTSYVDAITCVYIYKLKDLTLNGGVNNRALLGSGGGNNPTISNTSQLSEICCFDLERITNNIFETGLFFASSNNNIKNVYVPKLKNVNGSLFYGGTPNLIDVEVGEMITNLNCYSWNPTNVIADATKLATLNANIRNHIAAKVSDRTGLSQLTFTVSTNLLNNLEQATIDAFTAKNWIVAGA